MFKFNVSYYEESKPNGKRSFLGKAPNYEIVLFNQVLDTIHLQATKGYNYDWPFLNHSVFIQKTNMNSLICEYDVQIHHVHNRDKLLGNYKVEIECIAPPTDEVEQEILFEQYQEIGRKYESSKPVKSKRLTTWLLQEDRAIKSFILDLYNAGSLKKLKVNASKATYYRNLKVCEEKGYVKNGKLVKRVYVTKFN
jgi:hypothetical protein